MTIIEAIVAALLIFIGLMTFAMVFGLLWAFPIMWTWNHAMPHIFDLPKINWGQAWCLAFLAGNLIKPSNVSKWMNTKAE